MRVGEGVMREFSRWRREDMGDSHKKGKVKSG